MPLVTFLIAVAAGAQVPPPVVAARAPATRRLQRWVTSDVRCGERRVPAATLRRPYAALGNGTPPASQTYRFRVGADGRPTRIVRVGGGWAAGGEDLAPSLAASRLPAGSGDCEVSYATDTSEYAEIAVGDLVSYTLTPLNGPLPEDGWARIRPAGGDCDRQPPPQWRVHVSPDWPTIPTAPGARDWTLVGYDLDAKGRPVRLGVAAGTGNARLDRAALKAMASSRQTGGPRRGCLNPFIREASRLPAPADVDLETLRPAGATCPRDAGWARAPVLTYPEPWRRRAIEGWAVVAYDVAPWGEPGNLRVLASEPAADFGERAVQILRTARRAPSSTGGTGCIERVRFAMGPSVFDPPR